ncbi:MAG: 2-amino-4-hydroxy-6-hydroxymethyldihydropteridine diphosphokinase [Flavobacteriia bacterium]|nr:2-amino-4-hydroxy-6-hydroxymethyldihydropteridine diphosphokinase [Flavobacteriia bacterium]
MESLNTVVLSLGSNLGPREQHLAQAEALISTNIGTVLATSQPYYSEPLGFVSSHEFCNVCMKITTLLNPMELLRATQEIERIMGRVKGTADVSKSDRTMDIDILFFNELEWVSDELIIPHPEWHKRPFVVIPLLEVL